MLTRSRTRRRSSRIRLGRRPLRCSRCRRIVRSFTEIVFVHATLTKDLFGRDPKSSIGKGSSRSSLSEPKSSLRSSVQNMRSERRGKDGTLTSYNSDMITAKAAPLNAVNGALEGQSEARCTTSRRATEQAIPAVRALAERSGHSGKKYATKGQ